MTPRAKKRWFDLSRLALCLVALWIVIQGVTWNDQVMLRDGTEVSGRVISVGESVVVQLPDGETHSWAGEALAVNDQGEPKISFGLKTAWRESRASLLALATVILFPVTFLQALRFQFMLRAQNILVGYWNCVKLSFAGNFLNFATPLGSNAGDVFKAYFLSLHTDRKTEAVTSVLLDRIVGLGTLLLVAATIATFADGDERLAVLRPYLLVMLFGGVTALLVYLAPPLRRLVLARLFRSESAVVGQLRRVDGATRALLRNKPVVLAAVLLTVLLQGVAVGSYFVAAMALGMRADSSNLAEYYTYFYTGVVVQSLPGPPQGLGTVELAYRYFFSPYGSPSQIVSMAFAIRMISLVCALPGLLVTMTGSYKPRGAVLTPDELSLNAAGAAARTAASTELASTPGR